MNADADGTATSDTPEGYRRVDTPGKQGDHPTRTANGQATDAAFAAGIDEDCILNHFDANGDIGILHLHLFIGECPAQSRTDDLVHFHGIGLKVGVVTPCIYLE